MTTTIRGAAAAVTATAVATAIAEVTAALTATAATIFETRGEKPDVLVRNAVTILIEIYHRFN